MKWEKFLKVVSTEPVFSSSLLLAGKINKAGLQKQLSRWVNTGRLLQIRRGLYALAEPYAKVKPHPFLIANRLKKASYVSLQSALSFYGMIPENVPVVTSITRGRPGRLDTPLGTHIFQHVQNSWFFSYRSINLGAGQSAFIASPEKALLDLIYLTPRADRLDYLRELRLENFIRLKEDVLIQLARNAGSKKMLMAAENILIIRKTADDWREL